MTAAALLAATLAAAPALPQGTARYAFELAGVPVGVAELTVACEGPRCTARWSATHRLPAEAGGGLLERRIEVEVDRAGRATAPARVSAAGRTRAVPLPEGRAPAMLVELLLAHGEGCLDAADEESGEPFRACAGRAEGGAVRIGWAGVEELVRPGAGGFPEEVALPAQRARFRRDAAAEVPGRPPELAGTRVAGPDDPRAARRFCGVEVDPRPPAVAPAGLPPPRAAGASCREKTAAWLDAARAAGLEGRTAVGVAFDGEGFAWHAWAEVRVGGAWLPVDPTFGEAPARGPRFTLARFGPGDEAARRKAGERILRCWGRDEVE